MSKLRGASPSAGTAHLPRRAMGAVRAKGFAACHGIDQGSGMLHTIGRDMAAEAIEDGLGMRWLGRRR